MAVPFVKRLSLLLCLCLACSLVIGHPALADPYPSNVHVTPVNETTIQVTWSDNTWAQSYRVYRNLQLAADLQETETSYLDTGLTPGMAYYYRVCSVVDGVEYSSPVEQSSWAAPMNAPQITSITASPDYSQGLLQVQIAWTAVDQVTGYEVFLRKEGAGGYEQKTETIDTSAPDGLLMPSEETTFWYKVRAYVSFYFEEAGEYLYFTGPFGEPQPLVFEPINWGNIVKPYLYVEVWPWDGPWNREWLRELVITYADPNVWPQEAAIDSESLALLAKHLGGEGDMTELERQMADAIHPHGLALLIGAYQSPPGEEQAMRLVQKLQASSLLLQGQKPDGLANEALDGYYAGLKDMCTLVGLSGTVLADQGSKSPAFQFTSLKTQQVVFSSLADVPSLLDTMGEDASDAIRPIRDHLPAVLPDLVLPTSTPSPTVRPIRLPRP